MRTFVITAKFVITSIWSAKNIAIPDFVSAVRLGKNSTNDLRRFEQLRPGEQVIGKSLLYSRIQWLEYLWNHEKMFETGVVRANEY